MTDNTLLIKNLCLCYCENKPELISKTVNTISHLVHIEHPTIFQDELRLLDKIWKYFEKYGRNQESIRFGQSYARLSKLKILKARLETLQFLYNLRNTASSEHRHHDSANHTISSASSITSFDMPTFSLLSTTRIKNDQQQNGIGRIKSSTSLQKLLHYNSNNGHVDDDEDSNMDHTKSTLLTNGGGGELVLLRRDDETKILKELLFGLQGIETRYINGNNGNNGNETTTTTTLDRSTKALVNRFLECGWLYEKIRRIINSPTTGLVSQAFVANLSSELREYHRLLGNVFDPTGPVSLKKLHVWLSTPMQRLKSIASISELCQGGALLSLLYTHQQHGDPLQQSTVYPLLYNCTVPIRDMIVEWICNGIINDPYQEFFVSVDKKIDDEKLWYEKYSLRTSMIPSFLTEEQAEKIWITGKSINFLRVLCKDRTVLQVVDTPASPETLFQQQSSTEFHDMIISAYNETTRHLRQILDEKYHMMDHFKAIKRYLLLGQGDFIKYLMDLMEVELNKPANQVFYHNLQSLMDSAIRVTNAQFEKEDIIKRLDLRLMCVSASELGWDVCCLDYKLDGPLKTIFTEDNTLRFMRIFNHLWRVKRMEYTTCGVWKQLIKNSRRFSSIPEIIDLMHTCFGISNEMTRFVQSVNYYIMFEVLECSWSDLLSKLKDAKDLQQILEANNESLEKIIVRLLLDADEKSQDLAKQLRCIFDLILNFDTLTQKLFLTVDNELDARLNYQQRQYNDQVRIIFNLL
ncbi:unnamed protein product [Didymodactylos carnosus]|uniref:Gamma-tubulin complex component n=1 Tax=Didymodactylos carnosus TaxID=1234261 RepID=A0A8S2I7P3_9BILA|nr:unnamed protein product [Didymodactylos carnosus]CAF3727629.1 unnamed protein product [Didymodactylos carnosus]